MTEAEIYSGLTAIFRELFGDDNIALRPQTTAVDIDGWDSFNNLNIIAASELRFGVRLTTREIDALTNVGDLVARILAKLGQSQANHA